MNKSGFDYIGVTTPFYCHDGNGNFLFHKRSDKCRDEKGTWDCGGGRLDFGEDPREGVLREVKEEYGCDGNINEQLPYYSIIRKHDGKKTHWLSLPFIIQVDRNKVKNNEPDKIDEIGWFKLDQLPKPIHTGVKLELDKFKKRLDKYKNEN
ncbi:MAG: NUDIX hydrolase [Candidatus Kerfeldbacteria bacterium]|jgi:8-oxo-dGTP diphosphatase